MKGVGRGMCEGEECATIIRVHVCNHTPPPPSPEHPHRVPTHSQKLQDAHTPPHNPVRQQQHYRWLCYCPKCATKAWPPQHTWGMPRLNTTVTEPYTADMHTVTMTPNLATRFADAGSLAPNRFPIRVAEAMATPRGIMNWERGRGRGTLTELVGRQGWRVRGGFAGGE